MRIEMIQLSSAHKLVPRIKKQPPGKLSLDTLNKKVDEVTNAISKETDEIIKRSDDMKENSHFLEEIEKEENTWTNRIVEWLTSHDVFAFILSKFKFFKEASADLKELKSKEGEFKSRIERTEKDKKMFETYLSSHAKYKDDLEAEKARREGIRRQGEKVTFARTVIHELFKDGEREFNRLPTLKVSDFKDIKMKDITHPIMRFDDGFIIMQGIVVVNEFGELPQIQVFYMERGENQRVTGNWKSWTPPNMQPLIKTDESYWIKDGHKKEGFGQIKEFINHVRNREKIENEYDFEGTES